MSPEDGDLERRDNETARIEMFSNGVFTIAVALLVIEIGAHIGKQPSYLGCAISFLVIGIVWAKTHFSMYIFNVYIP